jgi:hypothetical protein
MIIEVTEKHSLLGKPERGLDALSLAFMQALDLPERCIQVSPIWLTLLNYSDIIVFIEKLPLEAQVFRKKFFEKYSEANKFAKMPKPFKFEMGWIRWERGVGDEDVLLKTVNTIKDWG